MCVCVCVCVCECVSFGLTRNLRLAGVRCGLATTTSDSPHAQRICCVQVCAQTPACTRPTGETFEVMITTTSDSGQATTGLLPPAGLTDTEGTRVRASLGRRTCT